MSDPANEAPTERITQAHTQNLLWGIQGTLAKITARWYVLAPTVEQARARLVEEAYPDGKEVWRDPARSTCKAVEMEGRARVLGVEVF